MIGFSGLSVLELRALDLQPRASVGAVRQGVAQAWPSGRTRLAIESDWSVAHQTDSARTVSVVVEISSDAGANWTIWGGFTAAGTADRSSKSGYPGRTSPQAQIAAPPAGVLVRTRELPGASPVEQGLVIRAT